MQIIRIGSDYNISFIYNGDATKIAQNVVATASVGAELTINSIISSTGSQGSTVAEYVLGNTFPGSTHVLIVNVTVNTESLNLPVTLNIATDSTESELANNSITKNLVDEIGGILCSDIGNCANSGNEGDGLGNHTANQELDMDDNFIQDELIVVKDSYAQALSDLGAGRKFRWASDNLDGVPSPNSSTIGTT